MPSNLPSTENVAISGVCLFRVARLNSDCSPVGGNGSGYVTIGIADFTAEPVIETGAEIIHKNGCGQVMYRNKRPDRVTSWTPSGNLSFFDPEALYQIFGGTAVIGAGGGPFAADTIGWASPNYDTPNANGVYLEVISQVIAEGAGDCITAGSDRPTYIGHIFPKAILVPGQLSLTEADAILVPFTGSSTANPNLYDGPWNDYPGEDYIPSSPYIAVGYSTAQYEAILAEAAAGAADLPAASA